METGKMLGKEHHVPLLLFCRHLIAASVKEAAKWLKLDEAAVRSSAAGPAVSQ